MLDLHGMVQGKYAFFKNVLRTFEHFDTYSLQNCLYPTGNREVVHHSNQMFKHAPTQILIHVNPRDEHLMGQIQEP